MLVLVGPDGIVGAHEVGGRAAVAECAPRLIGLTLEEGKHLLAALQLHLVQAQAEDHCRRRQRCGAQRPLKDQRSRRLASLFGTVEGPRAALYPVSVCSDLVVTTGRQISPLTAAALCVKPRGQMTPRQILNVDALKPASADFTTMRALAMRLRGLLRGGTVERLDIWLNDAARVASTACDALQGHCARTSRRLAMPCWNPGAMGRRRDRSTD